MRTEGDLPRLHGSIRFGGKDANNPKAIYDVKFYPYDDPNAEPIFAVAGGRDVYICRPGSAGGIAVHILKHIQDPAEDVSINSIVWSQDLTNGDPLLCVAGSGFKSIKIFNAVTGNLHRVLSGHGNDINDLAISPASPEILASCSADNQIRIWTLNPRYQKQPCAANFSGSHSRPILALDFHPTGKYLISGGEDTMVCLWPIPAIPNEHTGKDFTPEQLFPLFASSEVHSDYVDCIKFWGDLILSRACGGNAITNKKDAAKAPEDFKHNHIILWKIDGFPAMRQDLTPPIPVHGVHTRSAFGGRFQRLLTFELVTATPFYMRFSLFNQPGHHPILAMGNELSKYSFWDLQALREDRDRRRGEEASAARVDRKPGRKGRAKLSVAGDAAWDRGESGSPLQDSDVNLNIVDPFRPIPAHKSITIPGRLNFACRQVAWSNCGKWCVAVGDYQMLVIFKRWD